MYAALGNRDKQKEIRINNPDSQHCLDLEVSANACDGCKNNPHHVSDKIQQDVERNMSTIAWAQKLGDYADIGVLPSIQYLSPKEVLAARIAQLHRRSSERKQLAKMIGAEVGRVVGEILAVLFKGIGHGR
jgi:prolyl-tRNA editing enzyme YbaK/EbsC (Cys-tRNA(Pro) deacylase)